ncbi:hypothetical protein SHKM778_59350 [Streptomyces sp. KM77-8]|uniref:Peptidase S33 tripeptidyl aminopeptidase-like C-terminal domain-containing protein n=1 Tax=Streptomyces haneummycinicus TaxID=3074435 RepID=A0AAT9HPQ0_9ACTN
MECTDAKWPTDWRTWDRDNTRLHRDHPFMTWANAWMNLPCATWPAKQRTPLNVTSGKGLPPVLIVQSERDAATPTPAPSNCTGGSRAPASSPRGTPDPTASPAWSTPASTTGWTPTCSPAPSTGPT